MIDPEATSAKLGEGRLYLFVRDARVHEANRAWKNGVSDDAEEIRAHRHRQKVELAVPLGDGGCQGPVEIEKAPGGLRALVGCDGAPRPIAARVGCGAKATPRPRPSREVKLGRQAGRFAAARAPPPVEAKPAVSPMAAQRLSEHDAAGAARASSRSMRWRPAPSPSPSGGPGTEAGRRRSSRRRPAARRCRRPSAPPPRRRLAPVCRRRSRRTTRSRRVAEARPSDAPGGGGRQRRHRVRGLRAAGDRRRGLLLFAPAARCAAGTSRSSRPPAWAPSAPWSWRASATRRMILGSSEAGITLLQSMPDPDAAAEPGRHGDRVRPPIVSRIVSRIFQRPCRSGFRRRSARRPRRRARRQPRRPTAPARSWSRSRPRRRIDRPRARRLGAGCLRRAGSG